MWLAEVGAGFKPFPCAERPAGRPQRLAGFIRFPALNLRRWEGRR